MRIRDPPVPANSLCVAAPGRPQPAGPRLLIISPGVKKRHRNSFYYERPPGKAVCGFPPAGSMCSEAPFRVAKLRRSAYVYPQRRGHLFEHTKRSSSSRGQSGGDSSQEKLEEIAKKHGNSVFPYLKQPK